MPRRVKITPAPSGRCPMSLEAVGGVIRELAEAVALHDAELFAAPRDRSQPEWVSVEAAMPQAAQDVPVSHPAPRPPAQGSTRRAPWLPFQSTAACGPSADRTFAVRPAAPPAGLREAILQGRIELLLQVVAGLPGRKVRMYELLGQMADGEDVVSSDRVMAGPSRSDSARGTAASCLAMPSRSRGT